MGVIFYRNWELAIISFVVIPATAYPAQLIGKKIKNASGRSLNVMGGLTAILAGDLFRHQGHQGFWPGKSDYCQLRRQPTWNFSTRCAGI